MPLYTPPAAAGVSTPYRVEVPGGRISLASGVPVMMTTQSAKTTVYYTPRFGSSCLVPLYDGSTMTMTDFSEVSQATTDTTKSPAAVANNSVYDLFAWDDAGTKRVTRGPVWTNTTTPSAGTALTTVLGVPLNSVSITNGPAASRGTYVGTIASNGSAQIDYIFGASGVAALFGVWNAYNPFPTATSVTDPVSYTYTSATIRQAHGSATQQVSFVQGRSTTPIHFTYSSTMRSTTVSGAFGQTGVGFDSTTTYGVQPSFFQTGSTTQVFMNICTTGIWQAAEGLHVLSANEGADGADVWTFNAGSTNYLTATIWN